MSEPVYDEDLVNLGYLKRKISDTEEEINENYKYVSRNYASRPGTPYYKGDTWIDGDKVYTCINTRLIGLYNENDWVTESGATAKAASKNKTYVTQPSNYSPGDMWILQSDNDHRAGTKGEILISTAGRTIYDADDWVNMIGYGTITSINQVANNLSGALERIGVVEEAIEDGLIVTFYQSSVPEGIHIGDLWYVTGETTGYETGKIYRYNGNSWDLLNDPSIQAAFDEANEARLVADGKIQSFYSGTQPSGTDIGVGDIWIDTANNNKLYRYNGTNWVACYDTRMDQTVTTVEETTERVATIESDLGQISSTVSQTTTRVTTIEGNIDNLQDQIDGTQAGVNNIINTMSTAEGKNIYLDDSSDQPIISAKLNGETSQNIKQLPNTYTQVEYIQSSGTQYINTGVLGNQIDTVEMIFEYPTLPNAVNNLIGNRENGTAISHIRIDNDNSLRPWFGNGLVTNVTIEANKKYKVKTYCVSGSQSTYVNDVLKGSTTFTINYGNTLPYYLFALCDTNGSAVYKSSIKLYSCKMTKNGVMIHNYVPCYRNNDNVIGLYDLVNGVFYTNAGTGTFTKGNNTTMPNPDFPSVIENVEGRNLLNVTANSQTVSGVTFTVNPDKTITANGTATAQIQLYLDTSSYNGIIKKAGDYFLSATDTDSSSTYFVQVQLQNADTGRTYLSSSNSTSVPLTMANKFRSYIIIRNGVTVDNVIFKPQFEKSPVKTPYVPYNNIQIKKVNKNILNPLLENGTINATTGAEEPSASTFVRTPYYIDISKSNYWVFSRKIDTTNIKCRYYDENYNYLGYTPQIGQVLIGKIEKPTNAKYIRMVVDINNINYFTDYEAQLEAVNTSEDTATDYIAHEEQTYNFPLSEGQKLMEGSYLANDGIHNVRKQVVLDGTENWTDLWVSSNGRYEYQCTDALSDSKRQAGSTNNVICKSDYYVATHYDGGTGSLWNYRANDNYPYLIAITDNINTTAGKISIKNLDITTTADFKAWLSTHNVTVEYELAEEEIVPYTPEQQQAWNEISSMTTYMPVTNIYSEAYAEIEYVRNNGLEIYETRANATRQYTETTQKFAQQEITNESITNTVSETVTRLNNDYMTADQTQGQIDTLNDNVETVSSRTTELELTSSALQLDITDIHQNGVSKVQTSMGYTFDDEGLKINKSNAETGTVIDEAAIKVLDKTGSSNTDLLYAGYVKDGNIDYSNYVGQTIVYSKNMIVEQYLVIPGSRFETYENPEVGGHGTGVFEI